AFFSAADALLVQQCLENGASLIDEDSDGLTPLFHAVENAKDPLVVDHIFNSARESGIEYAVGSHKFNGRSVAHYAAAEAIDPAMLTWLSKNGVNVLSTLDYECGEGWFAFCVEPIHLAADREDGFLHVATLLSLGADRLVRDNNDLSVNDRVLMSANIQLNTLSLVSDDWPAIVHGAFLDSSVTSLERAGREPCSNFLSEDFFASANLEQVIYCVSAGASPRAVDINANTAIHLAAKTTSDPLVIDYLLYSLYQGDIESVGRVLDQTNNRVFTPLHLAAEANDNPEVAARLIAWGADVDFLGGTNKEIRTFGENRGVTPVHLVLARNDAARESLLAVLLAAGADLRQADHNGYRAIHFAALNQPNYRVISFLQQIDTNLKGMFQGLASLQRDDRSFTALHLAVSRDANIETIQLMLEFGFSADDQSSSESGRVTPLMVAAEFNTHSDVFFRLLDFSEEPCYQG
ncbi:MAG: ankyrin repeat domain-containing protein, partial [Pseudohongiella sp.]|nr:ankyrin repeat domain-containing protein [Pseudohongiella sp.]